MGRLNLNLLALALCGVLGILTVSSANAGVLGACECNVLVVGGDHYCYQERESECQHILRSSGRTTICHWHPGSCPESFQRPGTQCCKQYGKWHCPCPKP
jgi:hypothetical protein